MDLILPERAVDRTRHGAVDGPTNITSSGGVMASWRAHCLALAVRLRVRRRDWGDERTLTRRARRVFGVLRPHQWLCARLARISLVRDGPVRGEWIESVRGEGGVILYIHGGGYISCSAATHRPITTALARLTRWRVFGLDYRLAPEHRFPAALDDVLAAYRWLLDTGVEPSSVALAGDSAGGGLVLAMLVRARDAGLPLPAAAVCFSPWADLAGTGDTAHLPDGCCAMFHADNVSQFARAYLGDASPRDPAASPVFADLHGLPPVLLQVGAGELLLDDSRRVHDRIARAGGTSRLEIFDGVFHGWQMLDGVLPEARMSLRQAASFIHHAESASADPPTPARS